VLLGLAVSDLSLRSAIALSYRRIINSDDEDQSLGLRPSFRF
jgi:hypothetical protein